MARQFRNLQLYLLLNAFLMVLYTGQRLAFLSWNWKSFQNQSSAELFWAFVVGWRFDLSALCLLSGLFFLAAIAVDLVAPNQSLKQWADRILFLLFVCFHAFFIIINWGDIEFINFVGRRFTVDSFFIASEIPGKLGSIIGTYWPLAIGNILFLVAWLIGGILLFRHWKTRQLNFLQNVTFIGVSLSLIIIGGRGGFQFKPLTFVQAQVFKVPSHNNLVLNSTFTVIKSMGKEKISRKKWLPDGVDSKKSLNGAIKSESLFKGFSTKPNVVLIIVEGLNLEYLGAPVGEQTFAPFLQSLGQRGLLFRNFFANGRRSIEGIASIFAGIPSLMSEPFITSPFQTNTYEGLGTVLNKSNYQTSFFHGGANGTMFFDSFMKANGIEKYFGLNEYPDKSDYDGTWGIFDEPYLQYVVSQINLMRRPFFTSVFTLTSHHPFKVPEKYKGVFNKGTAPIHESIGYTDHAIQKFFESAQSRDWYHNTLFIITSDHTSQGMNPKYDNEISHYKIPLILFYPGLNKEQWPNLDLSVMSSQIDIMPSLVDMLKLETSYKNFLGQSIFKPGNKAVVHYMDGRYQLLEEDLLLEWTAAHGYRLFDWHIDPLLQSPLSTGADLPRKEELILKLQSHIDYFNQGMWDNKLYFPN